MYVANVKFTFDVVARFDDEGTFTQTFEGQSFAEVMAYATEAMYEMRYKPSGTILDNGVMVRGISKTELVIERD